MMRKVERQEVRGKRVKAEDPIYFFSLFDHGDVIAHAYRADADRVHSHNHVMARFLADDSEMCRFDEPFADERVARPRIEEERIRPAPVYVGSEIRACGIAEPIGAFE